jgi:NitT/TauT family transport system substrate-binding protein
MAHFRPARRGTGSTRILGVPLPTFRAAAETSMHQNGTMKQSLAPHSVPARLRKTALALSCALGLAAAAPPARAAAPALDPMTIGVVIWIGYGPFYVADALGLWKNHGMKVRLQVFNDPALIPPAIAGNAVEGGIVTYDQVIGQDAKGQHQAVVMPVDYSDGGDAIVAAASVKSVADFKGQKIAFNSLSPSDFLLSYALSTQGLSEKDIVSADMTPEAIPAAMVAGRIRIGVTYEPFVSQITQQGGGKEFRVIYSSHDAFGLICDVLAFDRRQIARHPAEIKAVLQGYFDGLDYMRKYPDKSAEIIGKFMGISPAEVKAQLHVIHNPTLQEMLANLARSRSTASFAVSAPIIGKILKAKGQIDKEPPFEETVDDEFLRALAAK